MDAEVSGGSRQQHTPYRLPLPMPEVVKRVVCQQFVDGCIVKVTVVAVSRSALLRCLWRPLTLRGR